MATEANRGPADDFESRRLLEALRLSEIRSAQGAGAATPVVTGDAEGRRRRLQREAQDADGRVLVLLAVVAAALGAFALAAT